MKYKHATWLKLYRDEEGAFARLPFTARAYAKQLLLLCDDAGRIDVGEGEDPVKLLVDTAGFRMGATRGDRRMMAMMFPLLFAEGYLVRRGRHVVVRNYVAAQRRWDHDETTAEQPSSNEAATTEQRPGNDRATTEQRSGNEAATEPELTPWNHDSDDASARARAHSSVPSSSEEEKPPVPEAPPAPGKRKRRRDDPPPFGYLDALRALAPPGSHFLVPAEGELDGGIIAAVRKRVRQFPDLETWRGVGAFIAAGGVEFPTDLTASWVASSRFCDAVTAARAWAATRADEETREAARTAYRPFHPSPLLGLVPKETAHG